MPENDEVRSSLIWARLFIVALGGSGVLFLLYFELALFRELRGTHKRRTLVSHLHTYHRSVVYEPRVIEFPAPLENSRAKPERVAP